MSKLSERFLRMKTCEYWTIAYRKRPTGSSILKCQRITGFTALPQEKFVTYADPFLYVHQGKNWLFYERQNLTDMKGSLWCVNLDEEKSKPKKVLEEPFHLSYPQVFRYGRYTYMLPETKNAGQVRLYRCKEFPGKWEHVENLLELEAVDTTLFSGEENVYYAFTYTEGRLEIYLCTMDKEKFRPIHKEKIYEALPSKESRPGGAFFKEDDRWYRPSQDCKEYYGQGLIINEVLRLDKNGYEEREYCRLTPGQIHLPGIRPIGMHTYNSNDQYEVIDILHKEISMSTVWKKVQWKIRNRLKKEK